MSEDMRKMIDKVKNFKQFVNEEYTECANNLDYNYKFDKSKLQPLIDNARKWDEDSFVEEYVYWNDIDTIHVYNSIVHKGNTVQLGRVVKDKDGKRVYNQDGIQMYAPYKTIIADKDYSSSALWQLILNNTKELQQEAKKVYHENKNKLKPKFKKTDKTIIGFHASPYKFETFKYLDKKQSGQIGAEMGFFFFKDIKYAKYYASTFDKGYIYECDIKLEKSITEKGEDVGTNWGRVGYLERMRIEGYDTVIIEDADTGYGITDEIIVFDDDNIKINKIIEI